MVQLVKEFASGIYNLLLGMVTTSKHLTRHAITIQYPKERWEIPARSRGMVVLLTDHETGKLNCTSCLLCEKACPSGAIDIEVIKDEKKKRHLQEFVVDFQKCCLCGLCEESCNFAAIKMATTYEYPEWDKAKLVYNKDMLAKAGYDVPYEKPVRKKVTSSPSKVKPSATSSPSTTEVPASSAPSPASTPEASPTPAPAPNSEATSPPSEAIKKDDKVNSSSPPSTSTPDVPSPATSSPSEPSTPEPDAKRENKPIEPTTPDEDKD